jgi:hypothetical protein
MQVKTTADYAVPLHHPAGFKGIVESGVLRATHFLRNDRVELLHAVEVNDYARVIDNKSRPSGRKGLLTGRPELANTTPFNTFPLRLPVSVKTATC